MKERKKNAIVSLVKHVVIGEFFSSFRIKVEVAEYVSSCELRVARGAQLRYDPLRMGPAGGPVPRDLYMTA